MIPRNDLARGVTSLAWLIYAVVAALTLVDAFAPFLE